LSMQSESIWRPKLIAALFYPRDVLPRKGHSQSQSPTAEMEESYAETNRSTPHIGAVGIASAVADDQQGIFSTTPTPARPMTSDKGRARILRSVSASSEASMSHSHLKTTEDADYPVSSFW
jgi:hypothetical protein